MLSGLLVLAAILHLAHPQPSLQHEPQSSVPLAPASSVTFSQSSQPQPPINEIQLKMEPLTGQYVIAVIFNKNE